MPSASAASISVRAELSLGATLGEGPTWDVGRSVLWFVDIKAPRVYRYAPSTGALEAWPAPERVGWILPHADGRLVAGLRSGPHWFDPADGSFTRAIDPPRQPHHNRLNDATTDASGRIWFGTMDDDERAATGRLYRWDDRGCEDVGLPPVVVTNGPAITADERRLFHTDSVGGIIWRVDLEDGAPVGAPSRFIEIEAGAGHPDGSTLDAEGCLWVGLFSGWGVRRYDPEGRLMQTVSFPVSNVTKIAFGGPDLSVAYATTAAVGLSPAERAAQPLAGDLFAFEPGVRGAPTPLARV